MSAKTISHCIKRLFAYFGLDIRKVGKNSLKQRTTMTETLQHISSLGFKPATVIDVGVAYGTHELYKGFPKARHLLIEPLS